MYRIYVYRSKALREKPLCATKGVVIDKEGKLRFLPDFRFFIGKDIFNKLEPCQVFTNK